MDTPQITLLARLSGINPERHANSTPGFTQTSRAPWARSSLDDVDYDDEVLVGFYSNQGGTTGEFSFQFGEFKNSGARTQPNRHWMRSCIYGDGWHALVCMPELIVALARNDEGGVPEMMPDQFVALLLSLGYEDRTLRYL